MLYALYQIHLERKSELTQSHCPFLSSVSQKPSWYVFSVLRRQKKKSKRVNSYMKRHQRHDEKVVSVGGLKGGWPQLSCIYQPGDKGGISMYYWVAGCITVKANRTKNVFMVIADGQTALQSSRHHSVMENSLALLKSMHQEFNKNSLADIIQNLNP